VPHYLAKIIALKSCPFYNIKVCQNTADVKYSIIALFRVHNAVSSSSRPLRHNVNDYNSVIENKFSTLKQFHLKQCHLLKECHLKTASPKNNSSRFQQIVQPQVYNKPCKSVPKYSGRSVQYYSPVSLIS